MKTAFVMDRVSRNAGGLFDACRRLAERLQSTGEQVTVFGVADDRSGEDSAAWQPVSLNVSRPRLPRALGYAPSMGAAFAAFAPDIVHSQGLWNYPSFLAARWRRRTGRPEVIHPHGMLDPWALQNSGWKKWLALRVFERSHLTHASCIRALCQSELQSIRQMGLSNPVCVIPNGIDLPAIAPENGNESPNSPKPKTLLYLGRLHPKKGLVPLIHAWDRFRQSEAGKDWTLAIAGWDQGGHEAELQTLATHLSIPWLQASADLDDGGKSPHGSITFYGPRFGQEKDRLYRSANAFILPSLSEGLPMVVLEAWGHGKPVVMTPMCNLPEGFASGAAIEISAQSESIATGLKKLASLGHHEYISMGIAARRLVESSFTWDKVAHQLGAVDRWLVAGEPKPPCVED